MNGNAADQRSRASDDRGAESSDRPSALGSKPVRRALFVFIGLLVAIAITAVRVLVATDHPAPDSFEFEIAKAALQVLVVATAGAIVGVGTFCFQQVYLSEMAARRDADEKAHKNAEQDRDNRRREDEVLRSVMDATLGAYHSLKKERRLLRALARERVTLRKYDDVAVDIIDVQLTFEELHRVAPLIDALGRLAQPPSWGDGHDSKRPAFVSVKVSFAAIEGYLQRIVTEYEDNRALVERAEPEGVPAARLERLAALIALDSGDFRAGVSYHVDNVVRVLQAALLERP